MSNFCVFLIVVSIIGAILYLVCALCYYSDAKGYSKINFRTFRYLYKVAPEKWEVHWKYGYAFYSTGTYSDELIHMRTYFDRILLFLYFWKIERKEYKERETEKSLELVKFWNEDLKEGYKKSVRGVFYKDEHTDP